MLQPGEATASMLQLRSHRAASMLHRDEAARACSSGGGRRSTKLGGPLR
jgi:hypothetical protein